MMVKGTAASQATPPRGSCLVLGVILTGITLFFACASRQQAIPPPVTGPGWNMPQEETYSIGDYQGSESGEEIPKCQTPHWCQTLHWCQTSRIGARHHADYEDLQLERSWLLSLPARVSFLRENQVAKAPVLFRQ